VLLRRLLRTRVESGIAVLVIGLGICANVAIYAVVRTALLRPLPYQDSDRLVQVWSTVSPPDDGRFGVSPASYFALSADARSFDRIALYRSWTVVLNAGDLPEQFAAARVTAQFFDVFQVKPALGRGFLPSDDHTGAPRTAILTHSLWRQRFSSDPEVIGKAITLNDASYSVIGVLPRSWVFSSDVSVFVPLLAVSPPGEQLIRNRYDGKVFARLREGHRLDAARVEAAVIAARDADVAISGQKLSLLVTPLQDEAVRAARPILLAVQASVGILLVIIALNVSHLNLARGLSRQREIATQLALGALPRRIFAQLMGESCVLASAGGVLGTVCAVLALDLLRLGGSGAIPGAAEARVAPDVLLVALLLCLGTAAVAGVVPAIHFARVEPMRDLRGEVAWQGLRLGRARFGLRLLLLVPQVALSVVLLTAATSLLRLAWMISNVQLASDPAAVTIAQVCLAPTRYASDRSRAFFFQELLQRVRALPDVQTATATSTLPFTEVYTSVGILQEGQQAPSNARVRVVSSGFFEVLGISVVAGRGLSPGDVSSAPRVALLNETAARTSATRSALGLRLRGGWDEGKETVEVVGVVRDAGFFAPADQTPPAVYLPHGQAPEPCMYVLAANRSGARSLGVQLRRSVADLDRQQPLTEVKSLADVMGSWMGAPRFRALLLSAFAGLGLVLGAAGIYGVGVHTVNAKARDFGIRLALGASPGGIVWAETRRLAGVALFGAVLGGLLAVLARRVIGSLLPGAHTEHGVAICISSSVTLLTAVTAGWLAARRALLIQPARCLRHD
jgi:putative ABC transport system permease protein